MSTIYTVEQSAAILNAIADIEMANNGYADFEHDEVIAQAVMLAGYTVISTINLFGQRVYRGFTAAAQKALAKESFGVLVV